MIWVALYAIGALAWFLYACAVGRAHNDPVSYWGLNDWKVHIFFMAINPLVWTGFALCGFGLFWEALLKERNINRKEQR